MFAAGRRAPLRLFQLRFGNCADDEEVFHPAEAASFGAEFDDGFRRSGADAGELLELLLRRGVQIDRGGGGTFLAETGLAEHTNPISPNRMRAMKWQLPAFAW